MHFQSCRYAPDANFILFAAKVALCPCIMGPKWLMRNSLFVLIIFLAAYTGLFCLIFGGFDGVSGFYTISDRISGCCKL
jgi:hypothetical protein